MYSMELLIGRIERCKNSKILVIHNKTLTEKTKKFGQKITLKIHPNGIEIIPKGKTHVTIAAQRKLRITITSLVRDKIIKIKNKNKVKIIVDLKKWKIVKKDLFKKGRGNPTTSLIPKNLIKKNAGIRKSGRTYYIDISSKKLFEISKEKNLKCLFNRIKGDIILIKSYNKEARKITPHSNKRIQIAIPKNFLNKKEIASLSSKSWLPIKLQMNLESFDLKIKDFFHIKEEKELVENLIKKGCKLKIKNPSDPYDFLINNKIAVEVHNSIPKYGDLVTRHKVKPALVRLRILEADSLTKNKKINKFFVIINKKWKEGKYIQEVINKKNKNMQVFFTEFENKWYEKTGDEIIKKLD